MRLQRSVLRRIILAIAASVLLFASLPTAAADDTIEIIDQSRGGQSEIALNDQGNPVVVYYEGTSTALHVCGDPTCAVFASTTGIPGEAASEADARPRIEMTSSGLAVLATGVGLESPNSGTGLVFCGDSVCGTPASTVFFDAATHPGAGPFFDLALDSSDRPVLVLNDMTVIRCNDAQCTSFTSEQPASGGWPSVQIDAAGNPVIAYIAFNPQTNEDALRLLRCASPTCDTVSSDELLHNTSTDSIREPILAIDSVGNPTVTYRTFNSNELGVVKCFNAGCIAPDTIRALPLSSTPIGFGYSMTLDSLDRPVIAAYDWSTLELVVARCAITDCSIFGTDGSLERPEVPGAGIPNSMVLDANDHPIISYPTTTSAGGIGGPQKVLACDDPFCNDPFADCVANSTVFTVPEFLAAVDCYEAQVPVGDHFIALGDRMSLSDTLRVDQLDSSVTLTIDGRGWDIDGPGGSDPGTHHIRVAGGGGLNLHHVTISGSPDHGVSMSDGVVRVTDSLIASNSDGLVIAGGVLVVENSTITGHDDSGITVVDGEAYVINSTFYGNDDAAFDVWNGTGAGTLYNSTVYDNAGTGVSNVDVYSSITMLNGTDCGANVSDLGFNWAGDGTCPQGFGTITGGVDFPADNGCALSQVFTGCPATAALQPTSEAVDGGDCLSSISSPIFGDVGPALTDQRGQARPVLPTACDAGAFELDNATSSPPTAIIFTAGLVNCPPAILDGSGCHAPVLPDVVQPSSCQLPYVVGPNGCQFTDPGNQLLSVADCPSHPEGFIAGSADLGFGATFDGRCFAVVSITCPANTLANNFNGVICVELTPTVYLCAGAQLPLEVVGEDADSNLIALVVEAMSPSGTIASAGEFLTGPGTSQHFAEFSLPLPPGSELGTWTINKVTVIDTDGQSTDYFSGQLFPGPWSFEVRSCVADCVDNNDFGCVEAIAGGPLPQTATGSSTTADDESGEPPASCALVGNGTAENSLWWSWTPNDFGLVQIDTNGSDFDTVLEVWTGNGLSGLASEGCDDDLGSGLRSKVELNVNAGETYWIEVSGYNGDTGSVTVNITQLIDSDGDGITDGADNCPFDWNPLQVDTDQDGIGDACQIPDDILISTGPTAHFSYLSSCIGGTAVIEVRDLTSGAVIHSEPMTEDPPGSGLFSVTLFQANVPQGGYEITFSDSCGGTIDVVTEIGYHDPSGLILDQFGTPINGATVTLLYSPTKITDPNDPSLIVVPDGSEIMSPTNRQNPMVSGTAGNAAEAADGYYGWDTIEGWFVVSAVAPDCVNPDNGGAEVRSEVLQVLPEHFNVDLVFDCPVTGSGFVPVTPCAVYDSRRDPGMPTGQSTLTVGIAGSQTQSGTQCAADGVVPPEATSVMVNVVAVNPAARGNLKISAAGTEARGGVVNYGPGNAGAGTNSNAVPVALSADGEVDVVVNSTTGVAATHVRLVVLGYHVAPDVDPGGLAFVPVTPCAVFDSRAEGTATGQSTLTAQITGSIDEVGTACASAGVVPDHADAVMVNVVAVNPTAPGNLKISAAGTDASGGVVNYGPGNAGAGTNSNAVPVALSDDGAVDVFINSAAGVPATAVRLIVLGYYTSDIAAGSLFTPITPCAVFDTRVDGGTPAVGQDTLTIDLQGDQSGEDCATAGAIPDSAAAMVNVVAVNPVNGGNLRIGESGTTVSGGVVNYGPGTNGPGTNSNAVPVGLGSASLVDVDVNTFAGSAATHVRLVVLGYYTAVR